MKRRDWNILTKSQWLGIGFLAFIITIVALALYFVPQWIPDSTTESELVLAQEKAAELEANLVAMQQVRQQWSNPATVPLNRHLFDPNTADSLTLRQQGLPAWMTRNVLRYRAKGGIFRTDSAFRKVYGMTDTLFLQIQPYIHIDSTRFQRTYARAINDSIREKDTTMRFPRYHEKKDTLLGLNSADTASLQYLRGIGPYSAYQIIRYRKQLGGFASVEQLREVENLQVEVDSLLPFLFVESDSIRTIPVNRSSIERLTRHPYLTFNQARALYDYRRENIRLDSLPQLLQLPTFTPDDLQRLAPYLSFE